MRRHGTKGHLLRGRDGGGDKEGGGMPYLGCPSKFGSKVIGSMGYKPNISHL